jgi:T5SS/PEP-CTERM-associated repeat protein
MRQRLFIIAAVLTTATGVRAASGAEVWFADHPASVIDGGAPPLGDLSVTHDVNGARGALYVWATLGAATPRDTIVNWSLTLYSSDPSIVYFPKQQFPPTVYNPHLKATPTGPDLPRDFRWEWVTDDFPISPGATVDSSYVDIGGVTIYNDARTGRGIGKAGAGNVADANPALRDAFHDPLYDRTNRAWLLATVPYEYKSVGASTITMEFGQWGVDTLLDATFFNLHSARITVRSPIVDPDFNHDNRVDAADLGVWRDAFGVELPTGAPPAGDADWDRIVDGRDFLLWQRRLGGPAVAPLAEPAALPLSVLVSCALLLANRSRRRNVLMRRAACVAMACLAGAASVEAATYRWTTATSGAYTTGAMWTPAGGPGGPADTVLFNAPSTPATRYTVSNVGGTSFQLQAAAGAMTLQITSLTLTSPGTSLFGADGSMIVGAGATATDLRLVGGQGAALNSRQVNLAISSASSSGVVTVDNLAWNANGAMIVGLQGSGQLHMINGSHLSTTSGQLGGFAGSEGVVTLSDAGTAWSNAGNLAIGNASGTLGALAISHGAAATNAAGIVGVAKGASSTGTVDVLDAGSLWTINTELRVGQGGDGAVRVSGGGAASAANAYIGDVSEGDLEVTGAGSTWQSSGSLVIGNAAGSDGGLSISSGADVTATAARVGEAGGASGAVGLAGAGSTLQTSGPLVVGNAGVGSLVVSAGAQLKSASADVASQFSGIGSVTVSGPTSTWDNTGGLRVGNQGEGALVVVSGGRVTAGNASVAESSTGAGDILVQGPGSGLTVSGRLGVGGNAAGGTAGGSGAVSVRSGGSVVVNQNAVIFPGGKVRVDGGVFQAASLDNRGHIELRPGGILRSVGLTNAATGTVGGVGRVEGAVINGGRVAPGSSPGILTIDGNYTQQAQGELEIEVGGTTPGVQHDKLVVTGAASLAGRLNV